MTANRGLKDKIRAYMAKHGVNYTTARRAVLAGAGVPGRSLPPTPPAGLSLSDNEGWFAETPTDEDLVGGVLEDLHEQLLNEPIGAYGLPLPDHAPPLRDPRVAAVVPLPGTLELDFIEDYDGDTMSNAVMRGEVQLTGELDLADALDAEAAGTAQRADPSDQSPEVTVELTERHTLRIEAGVLHERVAELAELQEVFSRTWAD